jgi:hypothetical protein
LPANPGPLDLLERMETEYARTCWRCATETGCHADLEIALLIEGPLLDSSLPQLCEEPFT